MQKWISLALLPAFSLTACVSVEKTAAVHKSRLVAVQGIVGSIKCAFAQALAKERSDQSGFQRLEGRVVSLDLGLKIVDTTATGGSAGAKAAGPFVFAVGGGTGSILPSLSGGITRTNTIATTIKVRLGLRGTDHAVCKKLQQLQTIDYGFSLWLAGVIEGLDEYAGYRPAGLVDSITYEGSFQVVQKIDGGAKFDIVFVGGDLQASSERNDLQTIKFTIQSPSKDVPFPEKAYTSSEGDGGALTRNPSHGVGQAVRRELITPP
jgi:hypothetical protein